MRRRRIRPRSRTMCAPPWRRADPGGWSKAMAKNVQILLARRPQGAIQEADFRRVESDMPVPAPGELLVRNLWLSVDPYMRGRMSAEKSYAAAVEVGQVMTGGTAGEVIESRHPKFKAGDHVVGNLGWQLYAVSRGDGLRPADPSIGSLSAYLGVCGMPGATAYI